MQFQVEIGLSSHDRRALYSLFGRPYRIVDYLLLAGLVWEKNTVPGWKFTIVYEQANRLLAHAHEFRDNSMDKSQLWWR